MDKKKVLAVLALTLATSSFFPSLSSAASTGNDKVDWLIKNNQVAGRDGGNLALKDKITRAEFTKMVVDFQGLKAEADKRAGSNTVYKDVSSSHWASGVINIATEKGFVKGDTNGKFYPDDYITYNEVLTVLSRLNSKFSEGSTRGHWADQFVKFAKSHGYLKDVSLTDNDLFNNAIREKVFEIIYNSYNIVPSYKSDSLIIDGTKKTDSSSNTVAPPLYTSDHSGDYYYNGRYYNGRYYYDGKWYDSPYYYDGYYYNGRYYYDGKWYDYPYYYDGYYYNGRYYYDGKWYDYPYYHDYYKVNYYVDGSLYDTRTVKRGNYHTLLAAPSKAGYIFKNWTDSSGRVYKSGEYIYGNLTLYANYEKVSNSSHVVSFYADNAYGTLSGDTSYTLPYGYALKSIPTPKVIAKDGYKFVGWDTDLTKGYVTSSMVIRAKFVKDDGSTPDPITERFDVRFTIDPTKGSTMDKVEYIDMSKGFDLASIPKPKVIEKDGYVFKGWSPKVEGKLTRNMEFTALFDEIVAPTPETEKYTVRFNLEPYGTSTDPIEFLVEKGTDLASIPEPRINVADGYRFEKWSPIVVGEVDGNKVFNAIYEKVETVTPTRDIQFIVEKLPKSPGSAEEHYRFNPTYPGATQYRYTKDQYYHYGPNQIGGAGAVEFSDKWSTITLKMLDSSGNVIKVETYLVSDLIKGL